MSFYKDGAPDVTKTSAAPNSYSGVRYVGGDGTYFFSGTIDELRVSSTARSANWILTEYNNQNAPGNIGADNFIKFGAETSTSNTITIRHRVIGGE